MDFSVGGAVGDGHGGGVRDEVRVLLQGKCTIVVFGEWWGRSVVELSGWIWLVEGSSQSGAGS
jgi:hypothetical protein